MEKKMKRIYMSPSVFVIDVEVESMLMQMSGPRTTMEDEDVEYGGNYSEGEGSGGIEINSINIWDDEW
jgi:hypothetical protein